MHYNYFRDYDPGIGRYVQSDPIGLDGGLSTYGYVGSAPLHGWDPRGLSSFPVPPPWPVPFCWPGIPQPCRPIPPPPTPEQCFAKCIVFVKFLPSALGSAGAALMGEYGGAIGRVINTCANNPFLFPISVTFGISYCTKKCDLGNDMPQPRSIRRISIE